MKSCVILFLAILSSSNTFAKECSFIWEAEILNVKVGKITDTIEQANGQIKITSLLIPEGIVKTFGAPQIHRQVIFDNKRNIIERTEEHIGKNKFFKLKRVDDEIQEIQNQNAINTYPLKEKLSIDGTSAPYLFYIFKESLINQETKFNILNKNKVIYSKIQYSDNKIIFREGKWSIDININNQKDPEKITVNDGNNTLVATILEKNCTK